MDKKILDLINHIETHLDVVQASLTVLKVHLANIDEMSVSLPLESAKNDRSDDDTKPPDPNPEIDSDPGEPELVINDEWQHLLDLLHNGPKDRHLFITGEAGTGKSTLLNLVTSEFQKPFAIVAPTGVAALRVGGQTIHSFFRFPVHALDKHDIPDLPPKMTGKYRALHTLFIDEGSMVRADMMDAIDLHLRKYGPEPDLPFGGIRIVLIGDPYQLPPVAREKAEKQWLKVRYGSECPYFFQALVWQQVQIGRAHV